MGRWAMDVRGCCSMVPLVRQWVRELLGGSPYVDSVELVLSELTTNAIRHSASAEDGGIIRIKITELDDQIVRVEVGDDGPRTRATDHWTARDAADFGRGLKVVGELAPYWGEEKDSDGRHCTWAEVARPL